jgi:hypothetical protein
MRSSVLARVINFESAGKERNRLVRLVSYALRELMLRKTIDPETKDLAAFVTLSLERIGNTIDNSVNAWEKRGYWVKADHFRNEWKWSIEISQQMKQALIVEDWGQFRQQLALVAGKLSHIKIPKRRNRDKPWNGLWKKFSDLR